MDGLTGVRHKDNLHLKNTLSCTYLSNLYLRSKINVKPKLYSSPLVLVGTMVNTLFSTMIMSTNIS